MKLPTPLPLRDAETDFVWVIVPFSRPENFERVWQNYLRQRFPFKRLVLVMNGHARNLLAPADREALILTSDAHQSSAKNTALHEIRKRGGGFTVVMDDDDYYGPQYLTEACGYAKTYDVIGKSRHFMSVDGNLWLCGRELRGKRVGWLTGGTIACWAENAPEYPQSSSGEDAAFCALAEKQGMRIFGTDLYHYLYRRNSRQKHAWRIDHEDLRMYESARGAFDLGVEDPDIVVNGNKLEVDGQVLGAREDAATLAPPAPEIRA